MVIHILKDGTRPADISGHIVKGQEAEAVYSLMNKISEEQSNDTRGKESSESQGAQI
jgi:hypothetical protein